MLGPENLIVGGCLVAAGSDYPKGKDAGMIRPMIQGMMA